MRGRLSLQAVVFAAAIGAALDHPGPLQSGFGSAQARETYTRKRVHGVWVKAHFARKRAHQVVGAQSQAPHDAPPPSPEKVLPRVAMDATQQGAQPPLAVSPPKQDPPSEQDPLALLRQGLEARAKAMAAASDPAPVLKRVTYDFETGYRTAIYTDGSVKQEPFDKADAGAIVGGTR
jgi:hypothetical protein